MNNILLFIKKYRLAAHLGLLILLFFVTPGIAMAAPIITDISPTSFAVGDAEPLFLQVDGSGFSSASQVKMNIIFSDGSVIPYNLFPTAFISNSHLAAQIPVFPDGTLLPSGGLFTVFVQDGSNTSNAVSITVNGPTGGPGGFFPPYNPSGSGSSGGSGGGSGGSGSALGTPPAGGRSTFNPGNVPNQVANLNLNDLIDILFKILWIVFVAFAIVMFLLAGIQFFTAQGDAGKVADARNFVLWGAVGMAVALLAFSLPFIVRNTLGNGV